MISVPGSFSLGIRARDQRVPRGSSPWSIDRLPTLSRQWFNRFCQKAGSNMSSRFGKQIRRRDLTEAFTHAPSIQSASEILEREHAFIEAYVPVISQAERKDLMFALLDDAGQSVRRPDRRTCRIGAARCPGLAAKGDGSG